MSQSDYRPEQMWAGEIINACLPSRFTLHYEYELTRLKPIDGITKSFVKPDIAIIDEVHNQYIALRFQGPPHKKADRKMKDEDQKIVLEGNGWTVVDFWYDEMVNLWTNNKFDKATRNLAIREVLTAIEFIWK